MKRRVGVARTGFIAPLIWILAAMVSPPSAVGQSGRVVVLVSGQRDLPEQERWNAVATAAAVQLVSTGEVTAAMSFIGMSQRGPWTPEQLSKLGEQFGAAIVQIDTMKSGDGWALKASVVGSTGSPAFASADRATLDARIDELAAKLFRGLGGAAPTSAPQPPAAVPVPPPAPPTTPTTTVAAPKPPPAPQPVATTTVAAPKPKAQTVAEPQPPAQTAPASVAVSTPPAVPAEPVAEVSSDSDSVAPSYAPTTFAVVGMAPDEGDAKGIGMRYKRVTELLCPSSVTRCALGADIGFLYDSVSNEFAEASILILTTAFVYRLEYSLASQLTLAGRGGLAPWLSRSSAEFMGESTSSTDLHIQVLLGADAEWQFNESLGAVVGLDGIWGDDGDSGVDFGFLFSAGVTF